MPKHLYPNLPELRAFVCSVRHLNFSYAARELGATPSAVSRQIASLEDLLGVALFVRKGRNLELTPAGQLYNSRVAGPLREIGNASLELLSAGENGGVLTVASVPTFTTKWLVPRLPTFLASRPELTLSFTRHLAHGDALPPGLDAAIRYGDGNWEGVQSDYLDGRTFILVSSPELAKRLSLRTVEEVGRAPRLVHEQAEGAWEKWAEKHHVSTMNAYAGPRFEQYSVLIQAAQSGLGLALVPEFLVTANLQSGTLVQPLDAPVELVDQGHYLCCTAERLRTSASLRQLREWMLAECGRM